MKRFLSASVLCLISIFLGLSVLGGCALSDTERQQIAAEAAKTKVVIDEVQAAKAQLAAIAPALEQAGLLTPERKAQIDLVDAKLTKTLNDAQQALAAFQAKLTSSPPADTLDLGLAAAEAAAPLFGPYGAAILAITNLIGWGRAAYNRAAGRKLAVAIDLAKTKGAVDFSNPETAAKLSASMGAAAKAIVDEAQGKALPLPI